MKLLWRNPDLFCHSKSTINVHPSDACYSLHIAICHRQFIILFSNEYKVVALGARELASVFSAWHRLCQFSEALVHLEKAPSLLSQSH